MERIYVRSDVCQRDMNTIKKLSIDKDIDTLNSQSRVWIGCYQQLTTKITSDFLIQFSMLVNLVMDWLVCCVCLAKYCRIIQQSIKMVSKQEYG